MNITEKTIPHIYRNKYLKNGGSTTIISGGATTNNESGDTVFVVDNLISTGTTSALSANLGRILKGMIDDTNGVLLEHLTYSKNNYLSKKEEDTAEKLIHFLEGIDAHGLSTLEDVTLLGNLLSSNFVQDSNGFGIYQDADGKYHLDIDNVSVRGKFTTESLEVKESKHIGGKFYSTKAGMICSKVEEYDTYYRCYFNTIDSEGRSIFNQFAKDDLAFMQTFNMAALADGKIGNRRFWRLVVAIGEDYIDLSKSDCESGSDKPLAGDSIVLLGNRSDSSRLGAIIFEPLYFRVYKGINSYSLPTPFIDLNPDESRIEAKLINVATGVDVNDTFNSLNSQITQIKALSDRCFTIWFDAYEPTLNNLPASEWTNNSLKNEHLQDIFYNTAKEAGSGGRAYRFELNNGVYSWVEITDKDTIAALELAKLAEDLADSKRRVFVELPTLDSVYDVGDIWVNVTYGNTYKNDELVCIKAKAAGEAFSISHWLPTSTATTAYLENLGNQITLAVTDSKEGIDAAKALAQQGINDAASALSKANSAYNLADSAKAASTENTTVILLNKDSITALANKISFDSSGNITNINKSGLVATADFADMFSEQVTADGLVSRADIATFITEDEAGELISNATISADKIDFIGKTTINGNFVVDEAGNVTMNNATVNGTINANSGTIGGLAINGNALTNEGFDNDAYIVMRNDANKVFCGIGGNVLPSITGSSAVARFENESDGGNTNDPYHSNYGANFAAILSAKNARYNIALAMNGGFILGMALRTDILTSSQTISRGTNVAVTLSNDALINVTLPTMYDYDDGHLVIICNLGSYGGVVYAGLNIENGVTRNSYISSMEDGNKIQANNSKGIHRMGFIYCHYINTTIADTPFNGCWLRIF